MNISYNWLKRYIDLKDDAETVAKILTSVGLEVGTVEEVESIKGGLKGLVVAEVLTCVAHPNSDHLHVCSVNLKGAVGADGTVYDEPVQIVCGAPNVAAGQKVICATIGTTLYSGEESFKIKRGKIRGEESLGMLCAEDEIGVGSSHEGIIVLPKDTPVGMPASEYYHIENDTLIEVDITPNRNDGASHYGVARDLYAYYATHSDELKIKKYELKKPSVEAFDTLKINNEALKINVIVDAPEAAPRYTGVSIKGVDVKESPEWLKTALTTIGLRPINNVVDVTNFVLHEMGQAMHAFDADKIKGQEIHVRYAKQGEKFVTLDGVERTMDSRDLMIANKDESMCIAGVFGGLDSGVTMATKNVFLESAYFDPVCIRKTARRHGLSTDASFRYERGCDPNNTLYVLKRCALLIQEVAGGEIAMDIIDVIADEFAPWSVEFDPERAQKLMGKHIGEATIEKILDALEIKIAEKKENGNWRLEVPRYRVDVQRECDVVEDILRIYGYNNIEFPEKLNTTLSYSPKPNPEALQKKLSEQLTAQGFYEIMNNSLTKVAYYQKGTWLDSCVKIKNPLSQDLGVMRQIMLFGGLESIQRNVNRKNSDLKMYEFGNCYHRRVAGDGLPCGSEPIDAYQEEKHLALWLTGNKSFQSWVRKDEKVSFYQLHAYVNMLLKRLGVDVAACTLEPAIDPNGDKCCGVCECFTDGLVIKAKNGDTLGYMAIVAPALCKQFDIDNPVYYADLYWKQLLKQQKQYKPVINDLPKFPEVKRDFALLVDKAVQFADLSKAAFETEKKLLKDVYLFDVYEGKNLEEGKKSYALSFVLQDKENTLKDKQIEFIMERLRKTFEEKFNAKLR